MKALRTRPFLIFFSLSSRNSLQLLKPKFKGLFSLSSPTTGTKDYNSTPFWLTAVRTFTCRKFRSLMISSWKISLSLSSRLSFERLTIFSLMESSRFLQLFESGILNSVVGSQVKRSSMQVHEYNGVDNAMLKGNGNLLSTLFPLTHSFSMHFFSIPWKHQKSLRFSDVFRVQRKDTLEMNGLSAKSDTA